MAVSFTRAPTVAPGDPITSTQLARLAKAFNDRLRSGLGDPTWRIHFLMMSLFRGIRNSQDEFTFPSELEFFWYFQNVPPENAWPDAPAGQPTGIAVSNLLGAFVFGTEPGGAFSEASHVNLITAGTVGMSPLNGWDMAKDQRGAVDPTVDPVAYDAPMRGLVVRTDFGITPGSKLGMSYGSWLKMPDLVEPGLAKTESKMLKRALNAFVREFRGSDGQRGPDDYHLQEAFDCQRFFSEQYRLAPNYGVDEGPDPEGAPQIHAVYPFFTSAGATDVGQRFKDQDGNTTRTWHPGFVLDGWRAEVSLAAEPVSFVIEVGGVDFVEVNLTPSETGFASDVVLLPVALLSTSEVPLVISIRLTSPLPAGVVEIEFTELQAHRPEIGDLYALLRVSSCDESNLPDGSGTLETQARIISDEYFRVGCAVNPHPTPGMPIEDTIINSNAVFEAARRMSQCMAITRRHEFIDYAVEGGKSILWFRREFGIGEGVKVRPLEGLLNIKHAAESRGMTNEWLLDIELRPYGEDVSDLFKPDGYTDIFAAIQRCHFNSQDIKREPALLEHIAYGVTIATVPNVDVLVPEAPSGWNYTIIQGVPGVGNANLLNDCAEDDEPCKELRRNFYKSCRIYETPVEVEKVEIEGTAPDEILKVTLTGRLHHCETAPASIPRNRGSWDIGALKAEPYRTEENGLREYLHQFLDGGGQCNRTMPGNFSATNTYTGNDPWGSCYPVFKWTQLIPFAYEDGNNFQNATDTHFRHDPFLQMELYLRGMCEGFVNGQISAIDACESGSPTLFDYRFEDLCMEAFGNKRIAVLPGYLDGYGPLPNTDALAAVFNQFSSAVNLLSRVRVMLPSILECNGVLDIRLSGVPLLNGQSSPVDCGGLSAGWGPVTPGGPSSPSFTGEWFPCTGEIGATYSVGLSGECAAGGQWELQENTTVSAYRFALSDGDSVFAIPELWRDMFTPSNQQILGRITTTLSTTSHTVTADPALATKCFIPGEPDFAPAFPTTPEGTGPYLLFENHNSSTVNPCQFLPGSMTLNPSSTGATEVFITRDNTGATCTSGGASSDIAVTIFGGQVPVLSIPVV
jgi:hypothetical protein